ncbi:hypothetical protein ACIQGZ_14760 [Streptomyces sp. NPDC092296]|uniref:hypothetical protein n=1 Tax=Streptomyces sp. NPDC092296 TaxID=3366012 RepID=UPI00380EC254
MTRSKPIVPFIAAWSGERPERRPVLEDPYTGGIAYQREVFGDRDDHGVLWSRNDSRPGLGQPVYARVHPHRQRYVMRGLRCQICAGPADRNRLGVLWLLHDDRGDWPGWPEEMAATHPPVCLPCARLAARLCPHLVGHHIAVRVRRPEVCGVHGQYYPTARHGAGRLAPGRFMIVRYGDPRARRVLASQLVMRLSGCTLVDLAAELAAAGTP